MALTTKIHSSYWSDEDVGTLTPEQKLAVLWVLTNKDMNNCGYLKASRRQFTFDTGLSAKVLEGACKVLIRGLLIEEREGSIGILALNYISYQFSDRALCGKNLIVKNLLRLIGELSAPMREALLERYKDLASPFENEAKTGNLFEGAYKPLTSPLQAPYKGHISPQSRAEQSRAEQSTEGGVGEGAEIGHVTEPGTGLRYDLAQAALEFLNSESGATFVPVAATLYEAALRLHEVSNDLPGVKKMLARQTARWKGSPKMRQYLRPATLFDSKKFHDYYGQREMPVDASGGDEAKALRAELQERIDTSPANRSSVYHRADCSEEDRANLKKWRAELAGQRTEDRQPELTTENV